MKRRILRIVLTVCMLAGLLTALQITASAATSGDYTYSVSGGSATITDVNTSISGAVTIPATLGGYPVTAIGDSAFYDCDKLTGITIPDSVTTIGGYAFYDCEGLSTVTIPDSVTGEIGECAFDSCTALTRVSIGNGVTGIGSKAFYSCTALENVTIGSSVTTIGGAAFHSCSRLSWIIIPDSVTSIGYLAFYNCTSLSAIRIGNGVVTIGDSAFLRCSALTIVTIPDSVTKLEDGAFWHCSGLTKVIIGSGVTTIGSQAFDGATNLTELIFMGDAPETVGKRVFPESVIFYCYNGTAGWPTTGTWQGRPLVIIGAEMPAGTITDTGRSISLDGEVFINQYITVSGFEGVDVAKKGGLLVWNSEVTEEEAVYGTADTTQQGLVAYGNEYTQRTLGIPMRRYADEVYLRAYIEVAYGEYVYGPLTKYSVQEYCEHKINTAGYPAKLKATCASLLHMGAMAQRYFNYNTGDLANANILEVYPAPDWLWVD